MALAAFFRRSAGLLYVISMHNPILPQNGDIRFHQEADDILLYTYSFDILL